MEYILYHIIALLLFYVVYKGFFAQSRRFLLNRVLVLLFPILPFIVSGLVGITGVEANLSQVNPVQLDEISIGPSQELTSSTYVFDWVYALYLSGAILMFLILTRKYYLTIRKIRSMSFKPQGKGGVRIARNSENDNYSFFNYIVLGADRSPHILEHEKRHVLSGHSYDILVYNIYKTIFWFNPFVYAFEKELKLSHEYEADQYASVHSKQEYAEDLLNQVFGTSSIQFINQFNNQNSIKMRIKMLKQSKKGSILTYLGIVPLMSVLFILGSWESSNFPFENMIYGTVDGEEVYDKVDKMPEFDGGMEGLISFMQKNIKYPKSAEKKGTEGKVFIEFVVTSKGAVTKAKVKKGANEEMDKEALRVVNSMPNWKPGEKDGKKVSVKMVLPIVFKLS